MKFDVCGPYAIPMGKRGTISESKIHLGSFWDEVEKDKKGLKAACGCYVLGISTGRSLKVKPCYIGKAESRTLEMESLHPDKIKKYNMELDKWQNGKPMLFFLPKVTPTGKFSKPARSKNQFIQKLEDILIGMALKENPKLLNISETKHLRELEVSGFLNTKRLARRGPGKKLRATLGF
jgi:hypothetical protein